VEQFAAHARQAYNLQDFDRAIAYYLRAYRLSPNGALLYNIAYIYDHKLGEVDTAMEFYRRYIRSEDADPDVVQRSTVRLQELKALKRNTIRKEQRIIPPLDTGPSPGPGRIAPQRDNGPQHQYERRSTQNIWGWSLIGVGGASLSGALVLGLVAGNTHADFNSATEPSRKQSLQDTGQQQALVADILLVAGAVAASTGLIMLLTDNDSSESSNAGISWGLSGNTKSAFLHLGGCF
jgi:tetratricopeptide (TPR) repeat protein